MPLVRITLAADRSPEARRAIADGVHAALVAAANVRPDCRFQVVSEVPSEDLYFDATYLGMERRAPVFIQIFMRAGRTVATKQALYAAIAERLGAAGVRKDDVLVNLVEVPQENWSFGGGVMSYPPAP